MLSDRYEGAWPDRGEKTKHASLKLTRVLIGNQCNWRNTDEMCVFPLLSSSKKSSGGILDRLNLPYVAVRHTHIHSIYIADMQTSVIFILKFILVLVFISFFVNHFYIISITVNSHFSFHAYFNSFQHTSLY